MRQRTIPFYAALMLLLAICSCTPMKKFVYFQDGIGPDTLSFPAPKAYRIQPNDNLYIQVLTSDEITGKYFNISSSDRYLNNDAAIELGSYKVNEGGYIDLPLIGQIKVSGLTTSEIKVLVQEGVSKYLQQASVEVKHVNRQFSILGEVAHPGTYSMYKDRISIFEALGYGGDLSDYGNRQNVKLVRHNGLEKEVVVLDLTKKDIIFSPYYYIMPNDVIYVEPSSRVYGSKSLTIGTILTAINTGVTLFYLIYNLSNTSNSK